MFCWYSASENFYPVGLHISPRILNATTSLLQSFAVFSLSEGPPYLIDDISHTQLRGKNQAHSSLLFTWPSNCIILLYRLIMHYFTLPTYYAYYVQHILATDLIVGHNPFSLSEITKNSSPYSRITVTW